MLFLFILAFFAAEPARADLPLHLSYFEDAGRQLTIQDFLAPAARFDWKPVLAPEPNFGQTASRVWFRFPIPVEKLNYGSKEPLFIEVGNAYIGRIHFYRVMHGKLQEDAEAGLSVPISHRGVDILRTAFTVFRITGPIEPGTEFFLSIEGHLPLSLPIRLMEAPHFAFHHWLTMFLVGVYVGCLLMAMLSNAVIAISLRSRLYLWYALFVFSMCMIAMSTTGLSVLLFWPEWTWWSEREMIVLGSVALIFYVAFLREFLESNKTAPRLNLLLFSCVVISIFRSVWLCFDYRGWIAVSGILASAMANVVSMAIAAWAMNQKKQGARFFLLSSLAFNFAIVIFLLQELDVWELGGWVKWAPFGGALIEVVLLSIALADRIRQANRELAFQRSAMVQAEKIAALGRMAGEIAHEINNPLAVIHGNAVLIANHSANTPQVRDFAATIEQMSNRISKVVKGMRALARDSRRDPFQAVALDSLLQDAYALCEAARGRGVRVALPNPCPAVSLRCRGSEISQVLVNLLVNAMDAAQPQRDPRVWVEAYPRGRAMEISVCDNGLGIPPEIRAQILEPFFTTKEPGKGLGLGLSISRTIVESHGGELRLDEAATHTRFVFTVPMA